MARDGKLRLQLLDVRGNPLGETVDIRLRNQNVSDNRVASVKATRRILIENLHGAPQGIYRIEVDPPSYLPVSQFVSLKASDPTDLTLVLPVDPDKVRSVTFQPFAELTDDLQRFLQNSDTVLSFNGIGGADLYAALDNIRKAGLLNIFKKAANTPLSNGRTVFPYFQKLLELRGDRFFAVVPKEIREETKHSVADGLFNPASEVLHRPPAGFSDAGSFKTPDRYGNLQLSFFMKGPIYLTPAIPYCLWHCSSDQHNPLGQHESSG